MQERTLLRGPVVPVNREPRERVAREAPRGAVLRKREQLEAGLRGDAVAERDAAVVGAHDHVQQALRRVLLTEMKRELVRAIAHERLLVEAVGPHRVDAPFFLTHHLERAKRLLPLEGKPDRRRQGHGLALPHHFPPQALLHRDCHRNLFVGRSHHFGGRSCRRRHAQHGSGQQVSDRDHQFIRIILHCLFLLVEKYTKARRCGQRCVMMHLRRDAGPCPVGRSASAEDEHRPVRRGDEIQAHEIRPPIVARGALPVDQ